LVDIVAEQELQPDTQDTITWNLSRNYTAKSAYMALFEGSSFAPCHSSIWVGAP
jgi:hypothetical protein